ncbi:MAG TPA: hypothetical protein VNO70_04630 [Blastocatellia bacterium]|nr:hypothetical protein [Blastocatellia bacterium]
MAIRFRLLGILPLIFFFFHALFYWRHGGLAHLLWMCNTGNLLLSGGLLFGSPLLIRVAGIWLIPGLLLWGWFVVMQGGWLLTSGFAHIGGLAVGLLAMSRVRADNSTWLYALGWYLLLQQVSRMVTAPELNVNVAHRIYDGWEQTFRGYWEFWLATTVTVAVGLWLLGALLLELWPPRRTYPSAPPALQSGVTTGWLLLMFAIIPNEALLPPPSWRKFYSEERQSPATACVKRAQCIVKAEGNAIARHYTLVAIRSEGRRERA